MDNKFSIGVDLGGTTIKTGIVSSEGKILSKISLPTEAHKGPSFIISQIIFSIEQLLSEQSVQIEGIGIGSPGAVIQEKGTVENPPNFPGWEKVKLGKLVSDKLKKDVFVDNDANAAAVGELIYGAGKELNSFIMVTLGTGVGGGLVLDREIYRGQRGAAGEIGHISVDYNGKKCKCGSRGCMEAYVGNAYLIEDAKLQLKKYPESKILELIDKDLSLLTPKIISKASKLDDELAKLIIERTASILGYGLASVVNLLDVKNVIIGGGVSGFGKPLYRSIRKTIVNRVMKPFKDSIKIIPAKLKNEAGIKGASALVYYFSRENKILVSRKI